MHIDWKRVGRGSLVVIEWIGVGVVSLLLVIVFATGTTLSCVGREPDPLGHQTDTPVASEPSVPDPGQLLAAAAKGPTPSAAEANSLFAPIHDVFTSPRCMHCHPDGDRPLIDTGVHAMNISRTSADSGAACSTCHADHNSLVVGGPPGAPRWGLPPAETPMIFQGRSITGLCQQLRDPQQNGQHTLAELLHHVTHDPLVVWAWTPGGDRTPPPLSQAEFVASFEAWVEAGGICPGETEPPPLGSAPTGAEQHADPEATPVPS